MSVGIHSITKDRQAFLLMIGKLLALVATFFMPVFLSRFLTVTEYGCYAQFSLLSTFLIAIFSFGVQSNLYYFYPRVAPDAKRSLIFNSTFCLMIGAFLVLLLLSVPWIRQLLIGNGTLSQKYWYYIGGYVLFFMISELLEPFYVVSCDVGTSLWFPAVHVVGKIIMVALFAFLFGRLASIFSAMIFFEFIVFLIAGCYYWRKTRFPGKIKLFDFALLKKQLIYVAPFGVSVILFTFASQFDKMLCIRYLTEQEYALYAIAFFTIPGIAQIHSSVGDVYLVNMAAAYSNPDVEKGKAEMHRLFVELTRKMFAFSFPLILGVCLFADAFIRIVFSEKYLAAVPYFRVHVFAFCFTMLGAGLIIRASGKTHYSLYAYIVSAVFTLPATYFGVRFGGIWGGVSMSMLSQFCPKFVQMIYEIKIMNISIRQYMPWFNFLKIIGVSVLVLCPFFFCYRYVTHNLIFAVSGGFLYIFIVYGILISQDLFIIDRKYFQDKYSRFRKRIFVK